jgi:hypothetical protein
MSKCLLHSPDRVCPLTGDDYCGESPCTFRPPGLFGYDNWNGKKKAPRDNEFYPEPGELEALGVSLTRKEISSDSGAILSEAHAEFIKRWYKDVFEHGYKHGLEDRKGSGVFINGVECVVCTDCDGTKCADPVYVCVKPARPEGEHDR